MGDLGGVPLPAGFGLPGGRIDLVGIQLDVFGPGGSVQGPILLQQVGNTVGRGNPNDGNNIEVDAGPDGIPNTADDIFLKDGTTVPDGWLVVPHDGVGITASEVNQIITAGINQSNTVRAAIRLPVGSRAKFVFAVTDQDGNVVGLYREPDATVFSIDVAVAKARNVAYYADPTQLQPIDQVPGVAPGFAFTNRTFRYLAEPRYPEGIDPAAPGPFSQLNDDPFGTNRFTGIQTGAPLPASAYQSAVGYDAFNPGTNFHDPNNILNQDGIVFFPGSAPLYRNSGGFPLIGGFGVSGDGVDQDDVATVAAESGFDAPLRSAGRPACRPGRPVAVPEIRPQPGGVRKPIRERTPGAPGGWVMPPTWRKPAFRSPNPSVPHATLIRPRGRCPSFPSTFRTGRRPTRFCSGGRSRTPYPRLPIDHSAERAGYPLTVSKLAAPSVTRFDNVGYIGGASLKNNNLCARGPGSAVGPVYDGTFATDYGGVRAHLGRVFLAPSSDVTVGRPIYLGYVAEGRRVPDVFALRPFRKAVLEKREDAEERRHEKEGHGEEGGHGPEGGEGKEGGH